MTGHVRVMSTLPIPPPIIKGVKTKTKGDGKASEQNSQHCRRLKTIQAKESTV